MNYFQKILKRPILTEKSNIQKMEHNKIHLDVAVDANKAEIKKAVETIFNVKVVRVNTLKSIGKKKRNKMRFVKQGPTKKAIVQLAEESNIEFIEGV